MLDPTYYKVSYKTSEARVLYLTARKGYKTLRAMARALGFPAQFLSQCMHEGIPLKYAGYLGRRFGYPPALLTYETELQTRMKSEYMPYKQFLSIQDYFNAEDIKYILAGEHIKDPARFLALKDKEIGL